jgi:dephospho-CoA kinase
MLRAGPMLRVGLTGGIACGKSTVAAMMRDLGCHVLDADRMAHRLIEPGQPAYQEVVREFGGEILDAEGRVDRARLAEIVFADPARLACLNAIVHPPVLAELDREFTRLAREDSPGVAVVEAALLVESGYHHHLDRLIVVWCTPEQQLARLTDPASGRGMTPEQARRRIAAQLSLAEKRKLATDEIDCSGTMDHTRRQVTELVDKLKRMALASAT